MSEGRPTVSGAETTDIIRDAERDVFVAHLELARMTIHHDIALVDQKTGILIPFCGVAIPFCIEHAEKVSHFADAKLLASVALFWAASLVFGISIYIALRVVRPRVLTSGPNSLFWKSSVFDLQQADYLKKIGSLRVSELEEDVLVDLRSTAIVCRSKFRNFRHALRFAEIAFVLAVTAEVVHSLG